MGHYCLKIDGFFFAGVKKQAFWRRLLRMRYREEVFLLSRGHRGALKFKTAEEADRFGRQGILWGLASRREVVQYE
jgi:hypothetical protein